MILSKKLAAIAVASCICAPLTACGGMLKQSGNSNNTQLEVPEPPSTFAGSANNEPATKSAENAEEVEATKSSINSAAYDYYNALATEWDKSGNTNMIRLNKLTIHTLDTPSAALYNGKIYFIIEKDEPTTTTMTTALCTYDINTKQLTENDVTEYVLADYFFFGGNFYCSASGFTSTAYVKMFDSDGNEVSCNEDVAFPIGITPVMESNGYIALHYSNGYEGTESNYCLDPKLETTEIKAPVGKDSHGLDTEIKNLSWLGGYNKKLYACGQNTVDSSFAMYCYDIDSDEWTEVIQDVYSPKGKTVGKFLIAYDNVKGSSFIYDMEKNKILADNIPDTDRCGFAESYYGGKANLFLDNVNFKKLQFPCEASEVNMDDAKIIGSDDDYENNSQTKIVLLDSKYYLFIDNAGVFLRTYEKGSSEEELVYRFEG